MRPTHRRCTACPGLACVPYPSRSEGRWGPARSRAFLVCPTREAPLEAPGRPAGLARQQLVEEGQRWRAAVVEPHGEHGADADLLDVRAQHPRRVGPPVALVALEADGG